MTPNGPGKEVYARRRAAVLDQLEGAVLFLPATFEAVYSADVHYRYRQDSHIRYLTGFEEPAALILKPRGAGPTTGQASQDEGLSMFVRPRDARSETWTGRRAGIEGAIEEYGADHAYPLDEEFAVLQRCLAGATTVYVAYSRDSGINQRVVDSVHEVNSRRPRNGLSTLTLKDAGELLGEMRLVKEAGEIELMRQAGRVSVEAHLQLMHSLRPGMFEYQAEAILECAMRDGGCSGPAYTSIVAGGANAAVLHYTTNQDQLRGDQLVLVDAGGEYGGYCADITRTIPVGRTYTRTQAELYDLTWAAQQAAIAQIKPGVTIESVHQAALDILVQGLIDLGIIAGSLQECLAERSYEAYYMHQTSHWLGMDVHDVGRYRIDGESRILEPGMVLTVEPGIYIRSDCDTADEYRGIGIRIEDDISVSTEGHKILSAGLPSRRSEIERIRRSTTSTG